MSLPQTPTRRSGRQRKSTAQYHDQVSWDEAVKLIRAPSNSPDRSSTSSGSPLAKVVDPDIDEDVAMQDVDQDLQDTEDEEDSDAHPDSEVHTPPQNEDDQDISTTKTWQLGLAPTRYQKTAVPRARIKALAQEQGVRNRMLNDDVAKLRVSKEKAWLMNFGSTLEDLFPLIVSRDVWFLDPRDVVLPSRKSISVALSRQSQGKYLDKIRFQGDSNPILETPQLQHTNVLSMEETIRCRFLDMPLVNEVVIGPWDQSKKLLLEPGKPCDLSQAWSTSDDQQDSETTSASTQPKQSPQLSAATNHRGWLINTGAHPTHSAWAPAMPDSQYLAISFKCSSAQRGTASPVSSKVAPAFSPSPAYPTYLQIWRIQPSPRSSNHLAGFGHSPAHTPQLPLRICIRWGNILRFEWLPLPKDAPNTVVRSMAILTSDGCLRIIDLDLSQTGTLEITNARSIATPPQHTIFSAFTLPSSNDLIIGGADGAVRLYDLRSANQTGILTAYTTIQIHSTYIMSVAVASDSPTFLASSAASGELVLTDLRCPHQDQIRLHKARLPTRNLSYLPHVRYFLTTSDAAGNSEPHGTSMSTVTGHNLRHFYKTSSLLKLPEMQGIATAMATSPFHPFMLVANAAGQVFSTSILRRVMPSGVKSDEGGSWQVKLFEIDWRPLSNSNPQLSSATSESAIDTLANEADANAQIDLYHGRDPRPGVFRLHQGFKPIPVETAPSVEFLKKQGNKTARRADNVGSAASSQCTYPEEQAVTCMSWNGNGGTSGWCCIAWGGGLVWIGDLAHGET